MKHLLLALFIGLTAIGCRDRETEPQDQLPPITQHGANTAGAVINGKVMILKDPIGISAPYSHPLNIEFHQEKGFYLSISGLRTEKNVYSYLSFYVKGNTQGNYILDKGYYSPDPIKKTSFMYYTRNNNFYFSDVNSGSITITKYELPIISGTFSGTLYNDKNPDDKIEITNGRFDININTLNK